MRLWIFLLCICWGMITPVWADTFQASVSQRGKPKYADYFMHFDYVNPKAPRKGILKQAAFGSFDSFNPFIIKGIAPAGIGLTHDTLMKQSDDEAMSMYGLVADGIRLLPNNEGVSFHINPKAKFSDGSSITAQDIQFSFNILRDKGTPTFRYYYNDVDRVEISGNDIVTFYFKKDKENRELALILGDLPVLSKAYWTTHSFDRTSLDIPVSSGPYRIKSFIAGRQIVYERRSDYWAMDLNVNRGFYNFEQIQYDYFRDTTVALEAFKAGDIDLRFENEAKKWISLMKDEKVLSGEIKMRAFPHHLPSGMQGFVFNLRRPIFQDRRVREALNYAFDFQWMNQNLFYGLYTRTHSFFDNSDLKAPAHIETDEEELLNAYRDILPSEVFHEVFQTPNGSMRYKLKKALDLLGEAGWRVQNGILQNAEGVPFRFEILLDSASIGAWERVTLPFVGRLKRLGIHVDIRVVDPIQYKNRLDQFDYDMIVMVWGQSLSPGNEQRYFWGSQSADVSGSMNYSGIKNEAVDQMIEMLITARDQKKFLTAIHALDRILLWEYIVIPHWYSPVHRYIFWKKVHFPEKVPLKGLNVMTGWIEENN